MDNFSPAIGIGQAQNAMQQQALLAQQQAAQQARRLRVGQDLGQNKPPAGSLIISDTFTPNNPGDQYAHGELVNMAARQNGFRGPVITTEVPPSEEAGNALLRSESVLTNPHADGKQVRAAIAERTAASAISFVEGQTGVVRRAHDSGARNTVLNMSQGDSKAGLSSELYSHAQVAWQEGATEEQREYGMTVAGNYAKAYNLDLDKLTSQDKEVSAPERLKLQQHLVNHVDHVVENSGRMKSARREWATEVRRFESNNNSVVISAGNHGQAASSMIEDAGGVGVRAPGDFQQNLLEIPEVTSVGATRWTDGAQGLRESQASYSSRSDGIDLYASGSVDVDGDQRADQHGTSFASPRAGSVMAQLHKDFPNMSSSQVENLMRNQLTHQLDNGNGGRLEVLDYQQSSDYLVGRRRVQD